VTVQLRLAEGSHSVVCKRDKDTIYKRTHKPHSYTFSGLLGTVDLGDNVSVLNLSLEDVPLEVL